MAVFALALSMVAGCDPVASPWDSTGYFKAARERSAVQAEELRQRAKLQRDRTHA